MSLIITMGLNIKILTTRVGYISFPYGGAILDLTMARPAINGAGTFRTTLSRNGQQTFPRTLRHLTTTVGSNFIFNNISVYRPYSVRTFGEWWIEPGDVISLDTLDANYPTFKRPFVLARRLKRCSRNES